MTREEYIKNLKKQGKVTVKDLILPTTSAILCETATMR